MQQYCREFSFPAWLEAITTPACFLMLLATAEHDAANKKDRSIQQETSNCTAASKKERSTVAATCNLRHAP